MGVMPPYYKTADDLLGCLPWGIVKIMVWTHLGGLHTRQAYPDDTMVLVPHHYNTASITIKQVVIFLLVEGLAFSL